MIFRRFQEMRRRAREEQDFLRRAVRRGQEEVQERLRELEADLSRANLRLRTEMIEALGLPLRTPRNPEAEARARKLLISHLTPRQASQLERFGYFEARGNATGHLYRIMADKVLGNVLDIRDGLKYCIALKERSLPICDHLLAQKLLIETDEMTFRRIANATWMT